MEYPKIQSVKVLNEHSLFVTFDNQETKRYDVTPLLDKNIFAPLKNPAFFKNIHIEIGGHAVYWNEDIDLSEYELWRNGVSI